MSSIETTTRIETFQPDGDIAPIDIALLHLGIRRWQEEIGQNHFSNIMESQADLRALEEYYIAGGGNFFIARGSAGEVQGFVGLRSDDGGQGTIKRLATLPEYQRQGIAESLVGELLDWAKANGFDKLSLHTSASENAHYLYRKRGFQVVGYVPKWGKLGDYAMELDLVNPEWAAGGVQVRHFDDAVASEHEVAAFELRIKQGVEASGQRVFDDIEEGYRELQQLRQVYGMLGGFWVAETAEAQLIGCVGLKDRGGGEGLVGRFGVDAVFRRQGIGTKLMGVLIDHALQAEFQKLLLTTGPQQDARALYEQFGFSVVGLDEEGDYVMRLDLVHQL